MILQPDFKEFIELLNSKKVEYLIVGGYAVETDFLKEDVVIQLGYEPVRIDILTSVTGLHFEDCYKRKVRAIIDEVEVDFIHLNDLKINKTSTGRAKDLGDVENL